MLLEISMEKSRAEIEKAYRQRLKDKNKEEYLRKESERKRLNYVPSHQLSDNDLKEFTRSNRACLFLCKKTSRQGVTRQQPNEWNLQFGVMVTDPG